MHVKLGRRGLAVLGFSTVTLAALGGAAYAVIPNGGVITGCYQKGGSLRVIDTSSDTCKANETRLDWSQTGPAGAKGDQGDTGVPGVKGDQGEPGPSDGWAQAVNAGFGTAHTGTLQMVGWLINVPAGSYVLQGSIKIRVRSDDPDGAATSCAFATPTSYPNASQIGNSMDESTPPGGTDVIPLAATATLQTASSVGIACVLGVDDSSYPYDAVMTAIRVGATH